MRRIIFALVALLVATEAQAQEFQVVVNADCELTEISKSDLSKIFQKKSGKLPTGESAAPVDLKKDAAVREAFSKAVHGRSTKQIESFWQQQIFSGKDVPPEQKGTDAEIVAWVKANAGAIGYVSAGASVAGVKVLRVIG